MRPHAPLDVRPEDEARYKEKVPQPNVAKFFGMIANIDDNVGRLLARLREWGIENDTLVIFMNDNGGTAGVNVYNAGMRGAKVTPWLGGTRASSLWRWPGTLQPADCDRLAAHIDFFPTLAELAGANSQRKPWLRSKAAVLCHCCKTRRQCGKTASWSRTWDAGRRVRTSTTTSMQSAVCGPLAGTWSAIVIAKSIGNCSTCRKTPARRVILPMRILK